MNEILVKISNVFLQNFQRFTCTKSLKTILLFVVPTAICINLSQRSDLKFNINPGEEERLDYLW